MTGFLEGPRAVTYKIVLVRLCIRPQGPIDVPSCREGACNSLAKV